MSGPILDILRDPDAAEQPAPLFCSECGVEAPRGVPLLIHLQKHGVFILSSSDKAVLHAIRDGTLVPRDDWHLCGRALRERGLVSRRGHALTLTPLGRDALSGATAPPSMAVPAPKEG